MGSGTDIAHLTKLRAGLLAEAVAAEQRVFALQANLAKEQGDVAKLRQGLLGFLQSLAMTDEMSKEQREAMEAAARLREGLAARDALYGQIDALDARIAAHDPVKLAAEAAATAAAHEAAAVAAGARDNERLMELVIRIEAIDFELGPLGDAVQAGQVAIREMTEVTQAIDEAIREPVGASVLEERSARAMLGEAHAALLGFYRCLESLPAPDDTSPRFIDAVDYDDRASFVDDILHRLLSGRRDYGSRLADAGNAVNARLERLKQLLQPVRARHAEVSQRRLAFEHQRQRVQSSR